MRPCDTGAESLQTSALNRGLYGKKPSCLGKNELFALMLLQSSLQVSFLGRYFVILQEIRMKISLECLDKSNNNGNYDHQVWASVYNVFGMFFFCR